MRYKSEEMKEKIISAIESFFLAHRRAPTITELVGLAGLSRSRVHAYLKELADICGIRKNLSTHCARHFFATYTLANGVSIESVAKMLGHSNTNMTRHYAKVLDQTILREMSKLPEEF